MNRGVFSGGGRHLEVKNDPVVSGRVRLEERGGRREERGGGSWGAANPGGKLGGRWVGYVQTRASARVFAG